MVATDSVVAGVVLVGTAAVRVVASEVDEEAGEEALVIVEVAVVGEALAAEGAVDQLKLLLLRTKVPCKSSRAPKSLFDVRCVEFPN